MQPDLLTLLSPKNIVVFVIILTRISGLIMSAPLFSTYPIPAQVKIWFIAIISFILFPMVSATTGFLVPHSVPELVVFLLREFAIGFIIGFVANFIFAAVQMGGEFISMQIGLSMSQVLDPITGNNLQIVSQFYLLVTTMVFIALNAHEWLFHALYQSYKTFPPGMDYVFTPSMVSQVLHMSAEMFAISISVILPIFCVMFVSEVLMGFMSKMMPQMNIFMVAIPLKVYVGFVLILMFLSPTVTYLVNIIESYLKNLLEIFV